jgi:hypothetical protein
MLAGVCKPVEWGKRHIEVDYASHPNLIDVRIICHPKDRKQTARLVTQIVETTTDSFDGDQLKSFKFADSCPGPAILYTPIGWLEQQVSPPKGAIWIHWTRTPSPELFSRQCHQILAILASSALQ